ncbi:MAG: collagenase [Mariniblastus sp.]
MNGSNGSVLRDWNSQISAAMFVLTLVFGVASLQGQETTDPVIFPPDDIFGRDAKSGNLIEVFTAADVSEKTKQAVVDTLAAASDIWGSSGRLEYWVLGTDRDAALQLGIKFCERRVARGQMTRRDCLADNDNRDHGFLMYQEIGAKALATGMPSGSAGHNGGAEWGFHRMTSSLPLGFAGVLNIAGEDEQVTIFHEYWHSLQNSFIQTKDHRTRQRLMGPVWFVEGSAVAMAEFTTARLRGTGKLPSWNNASYRWPTLERRMTDKMKLIQSKRKTCPTALPNSYDDDCRQLAYEGGAWAIAYLMKRKGRDVLLKSFHPKVESLGWEAAFEKTFGQSSREFKAEFETFLDLDIDEQVKVLKD